MGDFLSHDRWPTGTPSCSVDPDRFQNIFCARRPTASPRSWRSRSVRSWPRRSRKQPLLRLAHEAIVGRVRDRDQPIAPQLHRFSYDRAARGDEIEGASHFAMVSEPDIVAGVIRDAVKSVAADLAA